LRVTVSSLGIITLLATLAACNTEIATADYSKYPQAGSAIANLYVQKCGECHAAPAPDIHDKKIWPGVLNRMRQRMTAKKVVPLSQQEQQMIQDYLVKNAPDK
jgi:cytochrome c5